MKYQQLWKNENNQIMERYDLAMERLASVCTEESVQEPYRSYFVTLAAFAGQIEELARLQMREELENASLEELEKLNRRLYEDILPEHYETSYANPSYAAACLGSAMGPMLSAFYAQFREMIFFAFECRLTDITILCETLIEIYNMFEDSIPTEREVREVLYWFVSDYTDVTLTGRIREQLDPELSFIKDMILEEDLGDLRYLYRFGDYISDSERAVASYLNTLPDEMIEKMAAAYTGGYRKGFEVMGRDLSKKKTVAICYPIGFERMIRCAIRQFREMGLEPLLYRAPLWSVSKMAGRKRGCHASSPNRQYEYDHRYDEALYLDKAFKERRLAVLRTAYETYRREASWFAGPAVVELFGEEPFRPVNKPEAYRLSEKQEKLSTAISNESMPVVNQYIPGEETSFTIIAFPVPEIGEAFEDIFRETIRINTLDYEIYKTIQQKIIEVLDQAEQVHITGSGENKTDLRVSLHPLSDAAAQTKFENCVADVNIPLGEVFTSPVLQGTSGFLQVSCAYLMDFCFENLRLWFEDGMVKDYACDNFADPEAGRELIHREILKNHDTLPMGEFAIGTNTVAYAMAKKYGIVEKLPILIVEKMGPHFAVGDTCYSWSEDSPVYNPDGREVIARDNEISVLRHEDVSKAYFGCHLDITIPYSELGDITAVCADGRELPIIRQGRFVVAGTERLNEAFDEI